MNQEILELVKGIKRQSNGKMIATAESCTGGLLSSYLTSISGSSAYLSSSIITYSNESKIKLLDVDGVTVAGMRYFSDDDMMFLNVWG